MKLKAEYHKKTIKQLDMNRENKIKKITEGQSANKNAIIKMPKKIKNKDME